MKIKDMSNQQLEDAFEFLHNVPTDDPCYSGWNFDEQEYKSKLKEFEDEEFRRNKGKLY